VKSPRLIPVVIAATTALLIFKGIGLLTTGSYVLTGTSVAVAAGGGGHGASGGGEAAAGGGDPTMALPEETTMTDTAPVLDDGAETMPLTDAAAGGHGAAAGDHGAAAEGDAAGDEHAVAAEGEVPAEPAAEGDFVPQEVCPTETPAVEGEAAGHGGAAADAEASTDHAEPATAEAGATPAEVNPNCILDPGTNAQGDALALIKNSKGEIVPLSQENTGSEPAVVQRLGERRDSLDAREAELAAREDLLKAAEKQLDERTAELKAIEAKVNALVEEKKSAEQQQFVSIVAMYEQMKPKDAAVIFNALETPLLIKVASAMSPKKMGPILAKMDTLKAKALTDGMAAQQAEQNGGDLTGADLASLPQIVGQ
jgi:flagellar motility protein MotE (MotC chaperone)